MQAPTPHHGALAHMRSRAPAEVTHAIGNGDAVADPELRPPSDFTRPIVASPGWPSPSAADRFLSAGWTEPLVLEIILAIAVEILSRYSNNIFRTPLEDVFGSRCWQDPPR